MKTETDNIKKAFWTGADIAAATGGEVLCGNPLQRFSRISIDSRQLSPDDFFVAIKGATHDGHRFIVDALGHGVMGIMVHRAWADETAVTDWKDKGVVCVCVEDTTRALGDMAAFHRQRSDASLVAITGSSGKTTTRAMTASIVARHHETLSTKGNFNNHIGLPLTLLDLCLHHRWAVVELWMNHPGEIHRLAEICTPDIGVITNVGPSHLEGVGSIEGVMRAKAEMLNHIVPGGKAILNGDDPMVMRGAAAWKGQKICFGLSMNATIRAQDIHHQGENVSFSLILPEETVDIHLPLPGNFMVSNALAAATVGHVLGLSATDIKTGLENFQPIKGRMQIIRLKNDMRLMDDTYNANPESMAAAINTLKSLRGNQRSILVAGDMRELGESSVMHHSQIGKMSAEAGIAKLYAVGRFAEEMARGARTGGLQNHQIFIGTQAEIIQALTDELKPGDWILVKGSRSMGMEKIVQELGKKR